MCSFYHLPSTVIGHAKHRNLNAAYSFYNVATTVRVTEGGKGRIEEPTMHRSRSMPLPLSLPLFVPAYVVLPRVRARDQHQRRAFVF